VGFLAILAAMVVIYLGLVELGKSFFYGRMPSKPHLPIASWEHPASLQRIQRLASRWSVRVGLSRPVVTGPDR